MLNWILLFLLIGLIASLLGAGGVAGFSFEAAKVLAVIFLILLLIGIFFGKAIF